MKRAQNIIPGFLKAGLIFGAIFISGAVQANSQTDSPLPSRDYWIRIPATALSCQEEARLLAERFTAATHLPVKSAVCRGVIDAQFDGEKTKLYSLLLTYESLEKPPLYRASIGGIRESITWNKERGEFRKYSECVAQIPAQADLFARQTGLSAVTAFCEPTGYAGHPEYALNIDGFGEPKSRLAVFHLSAALNEDTTPSSFHEEVLSFLTSFGVGISRNVGPATYYYSKSGVRFRQQAFGRFQRMEECLAQEETALGIFKASQSTQTLIRCLPQPASNDFVLYGLADGDKFLTASEVMEVNYYSFAECMDDRARVLANGPHHRQPLGAICREDALNPDIFKMALYSL